MVVHVQLINVGGYLGQVIASKVQLHQCSQLQHR